MKKNRWFHIFTLTIAVGAAGRAFGDADTNSIADSSFREDLQVGIALTATANAPAGAAGKAQIIAVNNNGTNSSILFVKTTGLTNGSYSVYLTDSSGSAPFSLGTLNVASVTNQSGWEAGDGHGHGGHRSDRGHNFGSGSGCAANSANWTNWLSLCGATNSALTNLLCGDESTNWFGTNVFHWYTNTLSAGSGSFVLPSGLAQSNVAGIFISDANGTEDLTGDFSGVTNSTSVYIETVGLIPGAAATNVQGQATLTLTSKSGKTYGAFKLSATGLAARQKLLLTADGTNTSKIFSSNTGALVVKGLRRVNLVNLKTVVATDVSSNVVFSANF